MRRVFIYVNGILNFPGDSEGWTDRAVTWTHIHTDARAEKYEYLAGALTRRFKQQRRAEKLAKMISFYNGSNRPADARRWSVHLVTHSNGCDVALRTLRLAEADFRSFGFPIVDSLHLISPACEADCDVSGLTRFLKNGTLGNVSVRVAGKDRAMILARVTAVLGKPFKIGYGTLGRTGPINAPADRFQTIVEPEFGHSTWFEPEHFDALMKGVTQ